MKWLEAQQFKKEQDEREQKVAPPHPNKMKPAPQNKQSGKRHTPPTPPVSAPSTAIDYDAIALARSLGIDLATVTGTGPDGQILPRDVRNAATVQKIDFPPTMGHGEPPASE